MKKFNIGNIVYLNYATAATYPPPHPAMVVTYIYVGTEFNEVECVWFVDGILHHARFPADALQRRHGTENQ